MRARFASCAVIKLPARSSISAWLCRSAASLIRGCLFGLAALGHVDTQSDVAEERAVGGEPGHARIEHPSVFAIRPLQSVLTPEGLAARPGASVSCQTTLQVVRVYALRPAIASLVAQATSPKLQPRLVEEFAP